MRKKNPNAPRNTPTQTAVEDASVVPPSQQDTSKKPPPDAKWTEVPPEKFEVAISWRMAPSIPEIYVIKVGEDYARFGTQGGAIFVRSPRLATRVDSALWAQTLANGLRVYPQAGQSPNVRVKRLLTKGEKAMRENTSATWVKMADKEEKKE